MKVFKGGYTQIDCTGVDLLGSDQTKAGLYEACERALYEDKPIYANGLTWDNSAITPVHVFGIRTGENEITFTASTLQVIVKDDDSITINNLIGG